MHIRGLYVPHYECSSVCHGNVQIISVPNQTYFTSSRSTLKHQRESKGKVVAITSVTMRGRLGKYKCEDVDAGKIGTSQTDAVTSGKAD